MQCRNLDSVIQFADKHKWNPREVPAKLRMVNPAAEEKSVWRQKVQLDEEIGHRIPYNELQYTWTKDMHIKLEWREGLGEVSGDDKSLCFGRCTTAANADDRSSSE
jgi:hypothetical protein